jgi:hypothetical protein
MLVGYLRDLTGSYQIGFTGLVLVALAGAAAVALLPVRPVAPDAPSPQAKSLSS